MPSRAISTMLALLVAVGCTSRPADAPRAPRLADLPDIDVAEALRDITTLASDAFEGRAPGGPGEARTVQFLIDRFTAAGLQPGAPDGGWTQRVPLVSLTGRADGPLIVRQGGRTRAFRVLDEFVPFSRRVTDVVSLDDSELVFVGYGVQAPEFQWDDFKGLDVRGKTIVVLVNDPQVTRAGDPSSLDDAVFGGRAMTYYGRWTYKYEKAAQLGAAGCIIVHEEAYAGYPFDVVRGFAGERFDLVTPDKNLGQPQVQSWMSIEATRALFAMAGQDFDALKARAQTRAFQPVPLGLTASFRMRQTQRTVESRNVIARLPGSDPAVADEHVVFSAHWDHFGVGEPDASGDRIYNGAADNASGTAALIAIARALRQASPAPRRSVLFLAVTAEEQGLLGSQYYGEFPLYPLSKTAADINVDDNLPLWGRTKDVIVIGLGASELDDYLREAAAEQGRVLVPDAEPEKGFYYRSDHFNFAKQGVPALNTDDGLDYPGKPPGFGLAKKTEYTAVRYHKPSDQVEPGWDLSGYAREAKLLMTVGYRVANAPVLPQWKPGNEFKAIRDASLAGRR